MRFIMMLFFSIGLYLVGEFVAFALVAQAIGLDGAILVTLATSFAGVLILRRLGATARQSFQALIKARDTHGLLSPERLNAGLSAGFGGLLLTLPGFLSDSVGLLLLVKAARGWPSSKIPPWSHRWRPGPGDIVELAPQEWHRLNDGERR